MAESSDDSSKDELTEAPFWEKPFVAQKSNLLGYPASMIIFYNFRCGLSRQECIDDKYSHFQN